MKIKYIKTIIVASLVCGILSLQAAINSSLNWTAVTQYEDNSPLNPGDVVKYDVYRDGVKIATGLTGTSYNDTNIVTRQVYNYTVKNYVVAGNESTNSNTARINTYPPKATVLGGQLQP
jgi:hypothetical protein